jgi:predicted nucleic acid-binding protein
MKLLFDTSVLVAAIIKTHPKHKVALPWLQRIKEKTDTGLVAAHSVAELYAILTTLPIHPRIAPMLAQQLIQQNVLNLCEIVSLSDTDYTAIVKHLAEKELPGGIIYDALIVYAGLKAEVDRLVTLNPKDFRRIYPEYADKIVSPNNRP